AAAEGGGGGQAGRRRRWWRYGGGKQHRARAALGTSGSAIRATGPRLHSAAAGGGMKVSTECGRQLLARRVLHCTNAYGSSLLPELRTALVPVRNHVAATKAPYESLRRTTSPTASTANGYNGNNGLLLPSEPPPGAFNLDAAFYARGGYVYWSRREDGRVVVGGFRDVVPGVEWGVYDDATLDERVRQELHAYLPRHFPHVFGTATASAATATSSSSGSNHHSVSNGSSSNGSSSRAAPGLQFEAEWSGILGFTQDRFPFVGPVPGRRGQFLAAGFSGHGMTRTFSCGRVLAGMIAGEPPDPHFPAAWLPAPGRFGPAEPEVLGPEAAAGAVYVGGGRGW
ncbi:hypothetical protein Agub_g11098, partial [Astrephomene gubernaculifera]